MRLCTAPGCFAPAPSGRCPAHQRAKVDRPEWRRPDKLYGRRWRAARALFLRQHPYCVTCKAEGRIEAATDVDHHVPHRGDLTLFWDPRNWRSLCENHHGRKTADETRDTQRRRHRGAAVAGAPRSDTAGPDSRGVS